MQIFFTLVIKEQRKKIKVCINIHSLFLIFILSFLYNLIYHFILIREAISILWTFTIVNMRSKLHNLWTFKVFDAFFISISYQILLEWVNFVGGKKRLYVNCFFNRLHKPRPKISLSLLYLIVVNLNQKYPLPKISWMVFRPKMKWFLVSVLFSSSLKYFLSMTRKDSTLFVWKMSF